MKKDTTPTELIPEKLAELKHNAALILADVRMKFQRRHPFVGSVSMSLDLVPTRDARITTAATDGSNLYFDIAFLASLNEEHRMFVLAHEVYHNVMLHFIRQSARDRNLWNIATDLEINNILQQDGFQPPEDVLLPCQYGFDDGRSAEEYYAMLTKMQSSCQSGSGSSGQNTSGSPNGTLTNQFDRHIYDDENANEQPSPESRTDKYGQVGEDPDYMPEVKASTVEKIREAAISAAQQIEKSRGELPAHLKRLVDKLLETKVDWKDVLSRFMTKSITDAKSWNRPNRRFAASSLYLPGHDGSTLNVAVVIDTSGSTVVDSQTFLSELNGIVQMSDQYKITVVHCDTEVEHVEEYTNDSPLVVEAEGYEFHGGGGTKLKPALDYIDVNGIEADVIVVFTDGYTEKFTPDMAPSIPVLWLVTENGTKENIGFGEVVEFKK